MSQCPVCHQQIQILDQHHGTLLTCTHCQAVFFVGWDGQPEAAQPHEAQPEAAQTQEAAPNDQPYGDVTASPEESYQASSSIPESTSESAESIVPVDFSQPNSIDYGQSIAPDLQTPINSSFADVVDFGNTTHSQGLLAYSLLIEGIDLKIHEKALLECLSDSRFRWDVDELLTQVKNGSLRLEKLPPAKMMVLVQRLKAYPFKISCEQNALTV